jgi:hypothetical protein
MAAVLGLVAAGCGGTTPKTTVGSTTTTAPATISAKAKAAITTTWTKFFDYSTPEATRLALLQDGTKYSSVISSLTHLLPAGAQATVQGVKATGATAAEVTYSLRDSAGPLESGLTGAAVEVGGKWLVSSATFCGLVTLAGAKCPT